MTRTQDTNLPVSRAETAKALGMAVETLAYYYRTDMIPRPHRLGNACYYTADEARQIAEWWEGRKRLVFKREGEATNEVAPLMPP
jgi:hypothetical protein